MSRPVIRLAELADYDNVVAHIDLHFTKEGYGFVNRAQIKTEIAKGRVVIALIENEIVGVRIGLNTLWNLVVANDQRGNGIGRLLVEFQRPLTIRVKCEPVGHLSNKQEANFTDPRPFYEALGFIEWGDKVVIARNFYQKGGGYHAKGTKEHIRIYCDPKTRLFD